MKTLSTALMSVIAIAALTITNAAADSVEISKQRIVQPPPGAKVAAAYFTIENTTDQPLVITGASSDDVPMVSIHLSAVVDDVAKMIEQESVTIDAGTSLEFKHGSYHLMLMGLTNALEAGSNMSFEIETSEGTLAVQIPVITPDQASSMSSEEMDHGKMNHDNMDHDSKKKSEHGDHSNMESN